MQHAIRLAERAVGTTGANPAVGCVVVKDNQVISTASTGQNGRPHAEEACDLQENSEVHVTLEPCAHPAKHDGLSCTQRLINADVKKVIIGCLDPDPRTSGKGASQLKAAGIEVVITYETSHLYAGFKKRILEKRPLVSLKLATSLDGRIALSTGESKWITGDQARQHAHLLRLKHDGILVGTNTALYDQPKLNCRLNGLSNNSPKAFALNFNGRLENSENYINIQDINNNSLTNTLIYIVEKGVNTLLLEGGGSLAASMLNEQLIDKIYWYHAPIILGNSGKPAVQELFTPNLMHHFNIQQTLDWPNGDRLQVLVKKSSSV